MTQRAWMLLALLSFLPTLGCGFGGSGEYTVSGTVTFDNAPIPDGDIIFEPADGKTQHRAGKIAAGKYSVPVPAGPKVVKILATREEGERDKVMNMVARRQYIPPRYNAQSELKVEVSNDSSKNTFNFDLKTATAAPVAPAP